MQLPHPAIPQKRKKHKVPKSGPSVFKEPPANDKRRRWLIGPVVSLTTGEPAYLYGRFPVTPRLAAESDDRYTGTKKRKTAAQG